MKKTSKPKVGRRCKCGYFFSLTETGSKRKFESFAIVSDRDYQRFLRAENRVLRAKDEHAYFRAIGRSAELVGSLFECPDCGRILLTKPGGNPEAFYMKEE